MRVPLRLPCRRGDCSHSLRWLRRAGAGWCALLYVYRGGGAQNVINARNTTKLDNCVAFNCRFFVPLNVIVTDNTEYRCLPSNSDMQLLRVPFHQQKESYWQDRHLNFFHEPLSKRQAFFNKLIEAISRTSRFWKSKFWYELIDGEDWMDPSKTSIASNILMSHNCIACTVHIIQMSY